jgi:hypothetical protein
MHIFEKKCTFDEHLADICSYFKFFVVNSSGLECCSSDYLE